ncbi:LuxR C-terminal-related transcriptional regulator [Amycolatopsis sp. PS_44_ISF1]|uniref:helix-turn-helix transcriptional regulator n=1 Tax=Amycolatopsis sp. PS_44_ISF1 TaxID=2974917 RepID=UPI0028DF43F9|nr:LuxR C-terminal-related transcriptional regulator [Amycolatopsis sp. PS_44_ISF1]MDT8912059.1 LuxR C-terminal-related transcriptional regulator [Amycolatopsis sp. PS_44_ISF1]
MSAVEAHPRGEADVVVAVFEQLSADAVALLREVSAETDKPIVLVVDRLAENELPIVVECHVVAVLPRAAVGDDRLFDSVRVAAAGEANLPSDLLGSLVAGTERLYRELLVPARLPGGELSKREVDVLRLMADGLDTREIAAKLSYSDRTVKNIIYAIVTRLQLRNRSHAVAYAIRNSLI